MAKASKEKQPLISVVVPVYKVESYICKCVDSIINQTYKNLEIILVDDGSPDNCGKICDDYAKKDKRIKVIHKKNGGLSDARNAGIKETTGKYIGFVDSDDWIDHTMYMKLYQMLTNTNSDIAVCELCRVSNEEKIKRITEGKITAYTQEKYALCFFKIGSQSIEYYAPTKLYKREIIEDNQYPVGLTSEDVYGTYKAIVKAKKIVKTTEELYFYRYNEQSITGSFSKKDLDLLKIWDLVVEYTKKIKPEYIEYAIINRKRINFTLLYRYAKAYSTKELKKNNTVKKLLKELKNDEKILLKSKIEFKRKVLIFFFCRNYYLISKIL